MAVMLRNVEDVYTKISEEATSIANAPENKKAIAAILPFGVQDVFKPAQYEIGLVINEFITDPEVLEQLQEIGLAAIRQALIERPDLTVGLITGSAKNGHNFFDRRGK